MARFPSAALKSVLGNMTGNLRNLRQDETKAYQQQMGRWSKDVMKGIQCELFLRLMQLAQICRRPLDGFSHFLAKRRDPETPLNLARLVWGNIDVFTAELAALTQPEGWDDFLEDVPLAEVRMWQTVINKITFKHVVAFDLRIAQKIKRLSTYIAVACEICSHESLRIPQGAMPNVDVDQQRPLAHYCA